MVYNINLKVVCLGGLPPPGTESAQKAPGPPGTLARSGVQASDSAPHSHNTWPRTQYIPHTDTHEGCGEGGACQGVKPCKYEEQSSDPQDPCICELWIRSAALLQYKRQNISRVNLGPAHAHTHMKRHPHTCAYTHENTYTHRCIQKIKRT